ncbi:hypothetical protein BD413DRAFT_537293 [Trametes elegans]|nr:hypothetical protein BD413DRAFT_537293 [Trametes elegans]
MAESDITNTAVATCSKCSESQVNPQPPHTPSFVFPLAWRAQPGNIHKITESPNTPMHEILRIPRPSSRQSTRSASSTSTVRTSGSVASTTKSDYQGRPRPCVIMPSDVGPPSSPKACEICLMATFSQTAALEELPEILQRFCIHISPHPSTNLAGTPHVHTSPRWCKENAWLIAYRFVSKSTIMGRWQEFDATYKLDLEELAALVDVCQQKRKEWDELIQQDGSVLLRCRKQWIKSSKKAGRKKKRDSESRLPSRTSASTSPQSSTLGLRVTPAPDAPTSSSPSLLTTPVAITSHPDGRFGSSRAVPAATHDQPLLAVAAISLDSAAGAAHTVSEAFTEVVDTTVVDELGITAGTDEVGAVPSAVAPA